MQRKIISDVFCYLFFTLSLLFSAKTIGAPDQGVTETLSGVLEEPANGLTPTGNAQQIYDFDGFGQLIKSPRVESADYDAKGQLRSLTTATQIIQFGYNASGARIYKKVTDRATGESLVSLYPMESVALEASGRQSYVFVADSRLVRLEHATGDWFYYLKDQVGSSDVVMAQDGLPVEQMYYQAYGTETAPSATWDAYQAEQAEQLPHEPTHHRFTGHYKDDESGWYWMGARYYDPSLGRFITPDPLYWHTPANCVSSVRECNLYGYGRNNPMTFMDADGQSVWTKLFKVGRQWYKGGSAADAFADNVRDARTLFSGKASFAERVMAGVSLASEILPVSVNDAKDVARYASSAKVFSSSKPSRVETTARVKSVEKRVVKKTTHKNSRDYDGETHVYVVRNPDGSVNKIGESAQGTRIRDGASKRAEQQVRKLNREVGPGHTSEIRKTFPNKDAARTYETNLIKRYRRMYGQDTLPGNNTNR
ncbi:MAG: RHS repeat-associated core domain-containing protein [Pseudomonadota bacterium]